MGIIMTIIGITIIVISIMNIEINGSVELTIGVIEIVILYITLKNTIKI